MSIDTNKIDTFIEAARRHGEIDQPYHEVEDLEQMLEVAWKIMSPEQQAQFAETDDVKDVLDMGFPNGLRLKS